MKTFIKSIKKIVFMLAILILAGKPVLSDDTCIFQVSSSDDVPPNIVLLLDNGAEMEHIIWHDAYDNSIDYTPAVDPANTITWKDGSTSNGFANEKGYAIVTQGGKKYIVKILDNLQPDSYTKGYMQSSASTFTINGRTITLPANPSAAVDADGIKDNATIFRYSKNYLNWIFFSTGAGSYIDASSVDNGTDLPSKSRFYYAKKAIFTVAELTQRKAKFGIYAFTSSSKGASNVQPLGFVYDTAGVVDSNFVNNINNLGTFNYSPLAEGLASVGGYYASPSSKVVGEYCQKNFVIVISSGVSSEDQAAAAGSFPDALDNYDADSEGNVNVDTVTYTVPKNINGSSYLDDVAWYLFSHDVVDYQPGYQNVFTYTIGFMGNTESNAYLTNASNNGNGNLNLYNTSDKEYGKYHFEAENPDKLAEVLLDAINAILSKTSSFTAPVVPVTKTTSGDRIYLAFFKPGKNNFWEGNITKFYVSDDGEILGADETTPATYPNGAIIDGVAPYWATKNWADTSKPNYIHNSARNMYTYLGASNDLTHTSNEFSSGTVTPALLTTYADAAGPLELTNITGTFQVGDVMTGLDSSATATITSKSPATGSDIYASYSGLSGSFRAGEIVNGSISGAVGTIANAGTSELINYIRGADVYDENEDANISENRNIICGDPLHSEPVIVNYGDIDSDGNDETMVFFGANDGMLHAVNDEDGTEAWAFIPPDLLPKLKLIVEGLEHQHYVDSSPAVLIKDYNLNGIIEPIPTTIDGTTYPADTVYLVCGERKGGASYFALDITIPAEPKFLWRIAQTAGTPAATSVIPELGETWSDSQFGVVKTSDIDSDPGTDVVFLGGGYSEDNSKGNCILAINVKTGAVVKKITASDASDMTYSIPSKIVAIDGDDNGFTDKLYVGDMGGQIWRVAEFGAAPFPFADENINNWEPHKLFTARCNEQDCADLADNDGDTLIDENDPSKFFYPPTVTLEKGYDLLFIGSGDREDPCNTDTYDALYAIKDNHDDSSPFKPFELGALINADTTAIGYTPPNLSVDNGWYLRLPQGEKALAESIVFYKILYATTFLPNDDPCTPGGYAKLYALDYLTGTPAIDFNGDGNKDTGFVIGGGIPSKPVIIITETGKTKLLVSVGSTNPDAGSDDTGAGIPTFDPPAPPINFFLRWWRELFN
jgi:Tfp pilus tip-associated adhesin PilY1